MSEQVDTESQAKPNCYECKHRGTLVGDAHSCCRHSDALGKGDAFDEFMRTAGGLMGTTGHPEKLGIKGHPQGIQNGWFFWPTNFDPTWLSKCNGFEAKA